MGKDPERQEEVTSPWRIVATFVNMTRRHNTSPDVIVSHLGVR